MVAIQPTNPTTPAAGQTITAAKNPVTLTVVRRKARTGRWAILSAPTSAKLCAKAVRKKPTIDAIKRYPNLSGLLHRWATARTPDSPAPYSRAFPGRLSAIPTREAASTRTTVAARSARVERRNPRRPEDSPSVTIAGPFPRTWCMLLDLSLPVSHFVVVRWDDVSEGLVDVSLHRDGRPTWTGTPSSASPKHWFESRV